MIEIKCRFGIAEEIISQFCQDAIAEESVVDSDQETYAILKSLWYLVIPELGLKVHEGTYVTRMEAGEWMPDFSITLLFEAVMEDGEWQGSDDYLYYEQDGMPTSVYNWLGGRVPQEKLMNMPVSIVIDDEFEME